MNDGEFQSYLDALARKHLRYQRLARSKMHFPGELSHELDELTQLRRLLEVVVYDDHDQALLQMLVRRVNERCWMIEQAIETMRRAGVLDAIDEDPRTLFSEVRISALPPEDVELLQSAGHKHPDAELILITEYSRRHLGYDRYQERLPSQVIEDAPEAVKRAIKHLEAPSEESNVVKHDVPEKKKRKILNGVGKILSGSVLGVGNVLLGTGSIVAPNPAIAAGVIASGAAAVGSICQGLGDLRGE